ncbi:glycosyltransferase [Mycobacterium sp. MMS18-G62]
MKIAIVADVGSSFGVSGGADTGALNVHLAQLSEALVRAGHRVTVYTRRDDPHLPDRVEMAQGYTVMHVSAGPAEHLPETELLAYMGAFAQFLHTQWSADPPDLAHSHSWTSGIATQLAARQLDLPAVQTFNALGCVLRRRGDDISPPQRLHLEAMLARGATWVAATCTDEVFELARMGRPRARTSVVPCGVNLDLFTSDGPKAPRGTRHRIVSIGRLVPRTGFDVVVRALPLMPVTELVIVAGPDKLSLDADPEACRLLELATTLGVADRVQLNGPVNREAIPAILRSADVVACTPSYEGRAIVALEAMACGVPVVATAVGGLVDTVVHDVTGLLVPPNRPDRLADAINRLMRDDFLRQCLGAAGRDRARARYSWDQIAADTARIYTRLAMRTDDVTRGAAVKSLATQLI